MVSDEGEGELEGGACPRQVDPFERKEGCEDAPLAKEQANCTSHSQERQGEEGVWETSADSTTRAETSQERTAYTVA